MGKVWFTADSHFGHAGMMSERMNRPRPFADVREMNATLIANWNALIRPGDQVWHLGDFAHKCDPAETKRIFARLNGTKHLVVGNHDRPRVRELGWASVQESAQIAVDGNRFYLSHYAHRTWPQLDRGVLHLYGHSHGSMLGTRQSLDVGVDVWNFMPISVETILYGLAENADLEGVARPHARPAPEDEDVAGYEGP